MQGKAEDAVELAPAKDDNAAMRTLYPRTFAGNSDDCYRLKRSKKLLFNAADTDVHTMFTEN